MDDGGDGRPALIANVLTIAGTDPTGGAGIQADLKTFSALGVYGMAVVTAVVAQNTRGVRSFRSLDPGFVAEQIDAVFDDVRVDAVKIGMIATAGIAAAVAERLRARAPVPIVLDPVVAAQGGAGLSGPDTLPALRDTLAPIATLITPNLPEAGLLLGEAAPASVDAMRDAAARLRRLNSGWVLLKGGHLSSAQSMDVLHGPDGATTFAAPRLDTRNDHGTGCTLSAAIAASLPGRSVEASVERGKDFVGGALAASGMLDVGEGRGPLHHFHSIWPAGKGGR